MLVRDARTIWNALNGLICVYKPAEVSCNAVRATIVNAICKDLGEMKCRPATQYVAIEGPTDQQMSVRVQENLADNPLVVGPRYQSRDVRCLWATFLGKQTSGVLLIGINDGTKLAHQICASKPIRTYRVSGKFGEATDNHFKDGHVKEKSTCAFIKRGHVDKVLSSFQASHQKKMFELCGVDIQSQAAYELAIQGPIRPSNSKTPLLYGIKCVHFDSPNFTVEIQCVNEYELYLKTLIHDIGMKLHSTAHCTGLQCIRHSYFNLEHALLKKHWTLENIVNNLATCQGVLDEHQNILKKQTVYLQN